MSELAAGILEGGDWPELLPFMFQCVQSGQPRMVEAALLVFAQLARYLADTLRLYLGTLHSVRAVCGSRCRTEYRALPRASSKSSRQAVAYRRAAKPRSCYCSEWLEEVLCSLCKLAGVCYLRQNTQTLVFWLRRC